MSPAADTPAPELSARELAEISSLADGTLDPRRRAEVRARIDASPELRLLYERDREVVAALHRVRVAEPAPASLRARIEAQHAGGASRRRRRVAYGISLAAAVAAVVAVFALILSAGSPVAPSVSQAAALAVRGPSAPAPGVDPSAPDALLEPSAEDMYFPNLQHDFGWRPVGQRADRIRGRRAVTVYYEWQAHSLAYTIVGSPALRAPGASTTWVNGTELRTLTVDGRLVVTWRRDDHTCLLSGTRVPESVLERIAAWKPPSEDRD